MAKRSQGPRQKRVPQRMCVACRQREGKRALIRIVRTDEGVQVDPSGKRAGRGAYLHPNRSCWASAIDGHLLQRALRTPISEEDRTRLAAYARSLPDDDESV